MTDFEYLSVEQIIEINADQGGHPLDMGGIEAAAWRPQSGGFGVEKFPDVWSKAAAYVHGIASPQYFSDGNKRTGWFAATTFLAGNGFMVPSMPVIEAEFFVQSITQDVFDTGDEPDKTLDKAAEWFESKWSTQRVGPAQDDPRLEYAFLAREFALSDEMAATFDVAGGAHVGVGVFDDGHVFPLPTRFFVVARFHWNRIDQHRKHSVVARIVPKAGQTRVNRPQAQIFIDPPIETSAHPQHRRTGVMPTILYLEMNPVFLAPAECTVSLEVDGRVVAILPFDLRLAPAVPDSVGLLL